MLACCGLWSGPVTLRACSASVCTAARGPQQLMQAGHGNLAAPGQVTGADAALRVAQLVAMHHRRLHTRPAPPAAAARACTPVRLRCSIRLPAKCLQHHASAPAEAWHAYGCARTHARPRPRPAARRAPARRTSWPHAVLGRGLRAARRMHGHTALSPCPPVYGACPTALPPSAGSCSGGMATIEVPEPALAASTTGAPLPSALVNRLPAARVAG